MCVISSGVSTLSHWSVSVPVQGFFDDHSFSIVFKSLVKLEQQHFNTALATIIISKMLGSYMEGLVKGFLCRDHLCSVSFSKSIRGNFCTSVQSRKTPLKSLNFSLSISMYICDSLRCCIWKFEILSQDLMFCCFSCVYFAIWFLVEGQIHTQMSLKMTYHEDNHSGGESESPHKMPKN